MHVAYCCARRGSGYGNSRPSNPRAAIPGVVVMKITPSLLFIKRNYHVPHFYVGRGGALVETTTFNRRVVDSNPALAATLGP